MILVDIHAEATSDKQLLGRYLDGRVSAVLGTHTHVPTADEKILPGGTAFQADVGMTGPHDSILGRRYDRVLPTTLTFVPHYYDVATGDPGLVHWHKEPRPVVTAPGIRCASTSCHWRPPPQRRGRRGRPRHRPGALDPTRRHRPGRGPAAHDGFLVNGPASRPSRSTPFARPRPTAEGSENARPSRKCHDAHRPPVNSAAESSKTGISLASFASS